LLISAFVNLYQTIPLNVDLKFLFVVYVRRVQHDERPLNGEGDRLPTEQLLRHRQQPVNSRLIQHGTLPRFSREGTQRRLGTPAVRPAQMETPLPKVSCREG